MSGYRAFARYYDALTANVPYPQRAAYFDALARRHGDGKQGGLLLDLACGTGSLALEFAGLGYEVIGVDASAGMLAAAQQKAAACGADILFLQQPMQRLDLYGTVDRTVCALDSLNHLPGEQALAAVFARVSLFTNPGGLFLFDVNTAYKHREILADNAFVYELDELFCSWQNSYDTKDGSVEITLDFFVREADGLYRREQEHFRERLFSRQTIAEQLAANGFALCAVYGADCFEPPQDSTQRLVYVAQKLQSTGCS